MKEEFCKPSSQIVILKQFCKSLQIPTLQENPKTFQIIFANKNKEEGLQDNEKI